MNTLGLADGQYTICEGPSLPWERCPCINPSSQRELRTDKTNKVSSRLLTLKQQQVASRTNQVIMLVPSFRKPP